MKYLHLKKRLLIDTNGVYFLIVWYWKNAKREHSRQLFAIKGSTDVKASWSYWSRYLKKNLLPPVSPTGSHTPKKIERVESLTVIPEIYKDSLRFI